MGARFAFPAAPPPPGPGRPHSGVEPRYRQGVWQKLGIASILVTIERPSASEQVSERSVLSELRPDELGNETDRCVQRRPELPTTRRNEHERCRQALRHVWLTHLSHVVRSQHSGTTPPQCAQRLAPRADHNLAQRNRRGSGTTAVVQEPTRANPSCPAETSTQTFPRQYAADPRDLHPVHAGDRDAGSSAQLTRRSGTAKDRHVPLRTETKKHRRLGPTA